MSTFKRYLVIQAMMFVFGIVGPIFLLMFFASPPDPSLRWAFWSGLFITYADIMIALALTKGTVAGDKALKRVQGKRGLGISLDKSASSE